MGGIVRDCVVLAQIVKQGEQGAIVAVGGNYGNGGVVLHRLLSCLVRLMSVLLPGSLPVINQVINSKCHPTDTGLPGYRFPVGDRMTVGEIERIRI